MAKRLRHYPWYAYCSDRPAQRQRCPRCGYTHQGQHAVCDPCRERVEVTRREPEEQAD